MKTIAIILTAISVILLLGVIETANGAGSYTQEEKRETGEGEKEKLAPLLPFSSSPFPPSAWHDGFARYDFVMDEQTLAITPFKSPEGEKFGVKDPAQGNSGAAS